MRSIWLRKKVLEKSGPEQALAHRERARRSRGEGASVHHQAGPIFKPVEHIKKQFASQLHKGNIPALIPSLVYDEEFSRHHVIEFFVLELPTVHRIHSFCISQSDAKLPVRAA